MPNELLPTNIQFGTVVGRFGSAPLIAGDTDGLPDFSPATGLTVTFTPSTAAVIDATASPAPVTIEMVPIVCGLDTQGYLVGGDGQRGVKLIATDDTDINPSGWTYSVTFLRAGAKVAAFRDFSMSLPAGVTKDIALTIPVPSSSGVSLSQAQAAEAAAVSAASAAAASAAAAAASTALFSVDNLPQAGTTGKVVAKAADARTARKAIVNPAMVVVEGVGIDPTGATDSTVAIQALMDAAPFGATIEFPVGTFLVCGLIFQGGRSIKGSGKGLTIIKTAPNSTPNVATVKFSTLTSPVMTDIRMEANGYPNTMLWVWRAYRLSLRSVIIDGGTGSGHGIVIDGDPSGNFTIGSHCQDVWVTNFVGNGLWLKNKAFDGKYVNLYLAYNGTNLRVDAGNGSCFWTNLHVCNATGDGVVMAANDHQFENYYFESNTGYGLRDTGHENNYMNGRVWKNLGGGALFTANRKPVFSGRVYENTGAGLTFANVVRWVVNASTFYDNQATKTQTYGVVSTGTSDHGIITGGTVAIGTELATGSFNLVGANTYIDPSTIVDTGGLWRQRKGTSRFGEQGTSSTSISLTGPAGTNRDLILETASLSRWAIRCNNVTEGGSNAGSDLLFNAYDDAGALLATHASISRATGVVNFFRGRTFFSDATTTPGTPGSGNTVYVQGGYLKARSNTGILFDTTPRAAVADTSGATLAALEAEVNKLKALLRNAGLLLP